MELVAVAAIADNLAIGFDGELPWSSIPADKQQYRERVADAVVILGRRTFESMRGDLPGRSQIVLSSRHDYDPGVDSAHHALNVEAAIDLAERLDGDVAYVLGGAAVYEALLPHLDRMVLSRVPGAYDADVFFPQWRREGWELTETVEHDGFTLEHWRRVAE